MKFILAALLLGLVSGLEVVPSLNSTSEPVTEEVLVRCRRPLCAKFCNFGEHTDSNGCPICQCLEDPCLEAKCPMGQVCIREEKCAGHPCSELPYTCQNFPCPQVMCAERCEFGLQKNQYGCDTCICMKNPCTDIECNVEEECKPVEDPKCPPGAYCNQVGLCFPAPPPRIQEEPMEPRLPECPLRKCGICRFGYKIDDKGCRTCTCKKDPCEDVICGEGEKCKHLSMDSCVHDMCDLQPKCQVQPICEHKKKMHMDNMKMMQPMHAMHGGAKMMDSMMDGKMEQSPLDCDDRGNFKPRQCCHMTGECWCVNDIGNEIEGTRKMDKNIECPYDKTHGIEGHLQLYHNITEDLDKHYENLRPILVTHLGKWMMIEEKYIQTVEITPYGEEIQTLRVDFVISGELEDDIDLASSAHHMHLKVMSEETLIQYESFTLIPVPASLETHHQFEAEPIAVPIDERGTFLENNIHKTTIVIVLGLTLFAAIMVVILVQVTTKRKVVKLQRRDNYQQNLAFTNEVYGKLAFLDDLAKEPTPDVEKNEAIA